MGCGVWGVGNSQSAIIHSGESGFESGIEQLNLKEWESLFPTHPPYHNCNPTRHYPQQLHPNSRLEKSVKVGAREAQIETVRWRNPGAFTPE